MAKPANPTTANTGRDVTVIIQSTYANGGQLQLDHVTGFQPKRLNKQVKINRIDGKQIFMAMPDGYELSFKLARANSNLSDFIAMVDAVWYGGKTPVPATVLQYVTESTGQRTKYKFGGVVFTSNNMGDFTGENDVKQDLMGYATSMVKL